MNRIYFFLVFILLIQTTNLSSQTYISDIKKMVSKWYGINSDTLKNFESLESRNKSLISLNFKDRFDINFSHKIDTVIKLHNNNYLVFVYNNYSDASGGTSATYDIFELSKIDSTYELVRHVLDLCQNSGGFGQANYQFKLIYLNKIDYAIILKSSIEHHGQFSKLLIILNSEKILFDACISGDRNGFIGGEIFDELVKINLQNKILNTVEFKYKKIIGEENNYKIKETTFQIDTKDINLEFNVIMSIKKIKEKIYKPYL